MKHSNSLQHLKKFVYVDSSEEDSFDNKNDKAINFSKNDKANNVLKANGHNLDNNGYKNELKGIIKN